MQILMLHLTKTNNAQRLPKEKVFWNWLRTLNNRLDCVPTLQIKLDGKLSLTLAIFRSGEFLVQTGYAMERRSAKRPETLSNHAINQPSWRVT